jgi:hypothetical protein
MRDMIKEHCWTAHPIIGYVPLDEDGNPYQPNLGRGWRSRKKPITIYKTMARAVTYSPVSAAAEVRMFHGVS